jgi:ADP-ribose pyrophosphatase
VSGHGVFDVFESTWRTSHKGDAAAVGPFSTFECPDWCNVVAVTPASELVLVWQHRFGTDALSLELPGGVMDPDESPEAAAKRELREETGYEVADIRPLLDLHPNPALQGNVIHSFVATGARLAGATHFDANEECEVVRVPLAHARELITEGHMTHALCVVALQAFLLDQPRIVA